jgi:hypothetical protein
MTQDLPAFLRIYMSDGLQSPNIRVRLKSIENLLDLLAPIHRQANLSFIFELLLQYCQDKQFTMTYEDILLRTLQHMTRIIGVEHVRVYLDTYPLSLQRIYAAYVLPSLNSSSMNIDETQRTTGQVTNRSHHSLLGRHNIWFLRIIYFRCYVCHSTNNMNNEYIDMSTFVNAFFLYNNN